MNHAPNVKFLAISVDIITDDLLQRQAIAYFKQMEIIRLSGGFTWDMIREIYDGATFADLRLYSERSQIDPGSVEVRYDRKNPKLDIFCFWRAMESTSMSLKRHFDYLNLHNFEVDIDADTMENGDPHTMSDLFDLVSLQEHISVYFRIELQEIRLDNMVDGYGDEMYYRMDGTYRLPPQPKPKFQRWYVVRQAYFSGINIDSSLFEKIGTCYPNIQQFVLLNCRIPKENQFTNTYIIDLCRFKEIRELMFDFDVMLGKRKRHRPIYIHTSSDDRYYYYN
jgi:hypothetical protein